MLVLYSAIQTVSKFKLFLKIVQLLLFVSTVQNTNNSHIIFANEFTMLSATAATFVSMKKTGSRNDGEVDGN
jgi:hypothetical protein